MATEAKPKKDPREERKAQLRKMPVAEQVANIAHYLSAARSALNAIDIKPDGGGILLQLHALQTKKDVAASLITEAVERFELTVEILREAPVEQVPAA